MQHLQFFSFSICKQLPCNSTILGLIVSTSQARTAIEKVEKRKLRYQLTTSRSILPLTEDLQMLKRNGFPTHLIWKRERNYEPTIATQNSFVRLLWKEIVHEKYAKVYSVCVYLCMSHYICLSLSLRTVQEFP